MGQSWNPKETLEAPLVVHHTLPAVLRMAGGEPEAGPSCLTGGLTVELVGSP